MIYGKLRKDESSHWYLVPEYEIDNFDKLMIEMEEVEWNTPREHELVNEFCEKYDQYRLDGGVYDLKIVIE